MKVEQQFSVQRPLPDVWAILQDVPVAASCMPGAVLTGEIAPGRYTGRVSMRLGPFSASFEGEAEVTFDTTHHTGRLEGKGVDRRGGSRSKATVNFTATPQDEAATRVAVVADIALSGAIAQFGRTGLIQETAQILINDFARNLEERMKPPSPASAEAASTASKSMSEQSQVNTLRLAWLVFLSWCRRLRRPA